MKAYDCSFLKDILNNGKFFLVPVYQRNYSWREEECRVLLNDILKIYSNEIEEHFVGTIVFKPEDGNTDNLVLIDGQQRLTTMFLLCKAIVDVSDNEMIKERLTEMIFDKYEKRYRLTPILSDNIVYMQIMDNKLNEVTNHSSKIYQNYLYFKNRLENIPNMDFDKLYKAIDKLPAIKMELHQKDNPQIIFESINSTGLSLSIADLIRNYLLMNESYEKQSELFNQYWYIFEQKLGIDNLVLFFEHYLNIKIVNTNISRSAMYNHFKTYFIENKYDAETLLKELEQYVNAYNVLVNDDVVYILEDQRMTNELNIICSEIRALNYTVANMFLMQVLVDHKEGEISDSELLYSFDLILSYLFRRAVLGIASNALQKVFRYLNKQIEENKDKYGFVDSLNYSLIITKENSNGYFPSDEAFKNALSTRNLYGKFYKLDYLLLKLENFNNKTVVLSDNLTIEHILPQTLTTYWKEVLGPDYKILKEEYSNDLGNLTLTGYNSNMSNKDFESKKQFLLNESHLKLNEYIKQVDTWNVEEIIKRGKLLADNCLEIWKFPKLNESMSETIENDRYNVVTLSEMLEGAVTAKKLISVNFSEDEKFSIKSYRDFLETVIKCVYAIDETKFLNTYVDSEEFVRSIDGRKYFMFSSTKENANWRIVDSKKNIRYKEINNIYFDVHYSSSDICNITSKILENYNINPENVVIKYIIS